MNRNIPYTDLAKQIFTHQYDENLNDLFAI